MSDDYRLPAWASHAPGVNFPDGATFEELLEANHIDVLKSVLRGALSEGDLAAGRALMDRYDKMVAGRGNLDPIDYDILAGKLTDGQLEKLLVNEVLEI